MDKIMDILLILMMLSCVVGMVFILVVVGTVLFPEFLMAINECFA